MRKPLLASIGMTFAAAAILSFSAYSFFADASASPEPLVGKSLFREGEQATTIIAPALTDGSTNVAFYLDIDGRMWWQAEQLGSLGALPFSSYWDPPAPGYGNYVVVEYANDHQQFSCSGLSLPDCEADPHFIREQTFTIADDATVAAAEAAATESAQKAATEKALLAAADSASSTGTTAYSVPVPVTDLTATVAQAIFEASSSTVPDSIGATSSATGTPQDTSAVTDEATASATPQVESAATPSSATTSVQADFSATTSAIDAATTTISTF